LCWAIIRMAPLLTQEEIQAYTTMSPGQQKRILLRWRKTGQVKQQKDRRTYGRPRHLTPQDVAFIQGTISKTCDTYLDELQETLRDSCGVDASAQTIWRALKRSGFSMKKLTRAAIERSATKRAEYMANIGWNYTPEQAVFLDESACNRKTSYRDRAWAIRGRRALRKSFFVRGRRYSILPALSLDGILAVDIIEGSFTTARFARFVDGLLNRMNPFPGLNSVIIMDNCRIHKSDVIVDMIHERGMRCEFLPPYSPDYNPIELAFSAIKAHIRRNGHAIRAAMNGKDDTDVYVLLHEAVWTVTPENAKGWFHHCGYL